MCAPPLPFPGHDQFFFYSRSLPQALCSASLCSLKVLACVEVPLSSPSRPLNGSAPTLTLQHFKGSPKGGWANMDMRRCPCNKGGGWEGRCNRRQDCLQQEKVRAKLNHLFFLSLIIALVFASSFWQEFLQPHGASWKYLLVRDRDVVKQVLAEC